MLTSHLWQYGQCRVVMLEEDGRYLEVEDNKGVRIVLRIYSNLDISVNVFK